MKKPKQHKRGEWGNFIQCYNDFTNYKNKKLHLSSEQLYIYSVINLHENRLGTAHLNLYLFERSLPVPFGKYSNHSRNRIKKILLELLRREIIIIIEGNISDFSPSDSIKIEINREFIISNAIESGFEKIPISSFIEAESMIDYYIHCTVRKRKSYGFICSYKEWAEILECSLRNAIRRVDLAVANKAVFRKVGNYISKDKQEVNKYNVFSFEEEVDKDGDDEEKSNSLGKDHPF